MLLALLGGCEQLEGERVLVPGADMSVLIPSNWEFQLAPQFQEGGAMLEASSQQEHAVHLKIFVQKKSQLTLEDLVKNTLTDVGALATRGSVKVKDVTQIAITRQARGASSIRGFRVVHQLELPDKKGHFDVTQIADHLWRPLLGVTILVVGPKTAVETLGPELDSILSSVRDLTPEQPIPRVPPPDAVSSASQRATQRLFAHEVN